MRPSSSEAGPTGFRAFIIILPSADKRERQSVNAASVLGLREWVVGAGAREEEEVHLTVTATPMPTTRKTPMTIPAMAPAPRLASDADWSEGGFGGEGGDEGDGA